MGTPEPPVKRLSRIVNWLMFFAICFIWGSSFILMKLGLYGSNGQQLLSYTQVAALRICAAAIVLLPVLIKNFGAVPRRSFGLLGLSGLLGSLAPAFLFCYAETRIDSALAGTLNSLTPIFASLMGFIVFKQKIAKMQTLGILIGFSGIALLFLSGSHSHHGQIAFGLLVIVATLSYALNITLVSHYLTGISAVSITAFSLCAVGIPSFVILALSGFFKLPLHEIAYQKACLAAGLLGVLSTAIAWLLFYALIKRTNVLFTSTASYGIPFIALGWGWIYGETVTWAQLGFLVLIVGGVGLTKIDSRKRRHYHYSTGRGNVILTCVKKKANAVLSAALLLAKKTQKGGGPGE
jgi:drug/metabolite transporter (DMT)-like permease